MARNEEEAFFPPPRRDLHTHSDIDAIYTPPVSLFFMQYLEKQKVGISIIFFIVIVLPSSLAFPSNGSLSSHGRKTH